MHLFAVGEYDETLVVAERVASIQAEVEVDRAGRLMAPPDYDRPSFSGSLISLDNGVTLSVPQTPEQVAERMRDAVIRRTVMDE